MSGMRTRALVAFVVMLGACSDREPDTEPADLEGLTARLVELDRAYWGSGQNADIAQRLTDVAARRAPLWDDAARTDPKRALASVVPLEISVALPPSATQYVEQPYTGTAEVESLVADDLANHVARYELWVGDLELALAPGISRPRNGERFTATGYRHGNLVLVASGMRDPDALAGIVWASSEKVLAVRLNYSNKTLGYSAASVTSALSATASYYSSVSDGTVTLDYTVLGAYTSETAATCSFATIKAATFRALAVAGVDSNPYNQIVAVVPDNGCGYTGQSEVGQAQMGRSTFSVINDTGALTHELGHAHGLYHAHSLTCSGSDLADDESTCTYADYGHPIDIMGTGGGSFDAFGLENVAYLGRTGFGTANAVTTSGSYTLYPITGSASNTRVLKIPYEKDSTTGWTRSFYVEYHVATGLEAYISATNQNHDVIVTLATEGDGNSGLYLKSIGTGESFTAPNGMVLTVASADDTSATVNVTMPAVGASCTRSTPSIVLLEQSIETPTSAGATTQYAIELWNKDSAECGPSKFAISSSDLPAGWSLSASDVVAYGGSGLGNGLIYVTSPVTATGSTSFTITATDASVGAHTKSATLTYVVSSCTPVAPTVTLSPTSGMTVAAGGTTNYLLSFTNNNATGCGNSYTDSVLPLGPSGWTITPSTQNMTVAPGSTVTQSVAVTAPASATGTNTVGLYLKYLVNSHNYYTSLTSATATIGTTCVHTPPQITISPSSQTSTSLTTELDYTVTVKNLDGANCAATAPNTISLAVTPPSGVSATLDASSMSLAQGASATTTLRMTPTTTTPASYVATVTATNSSVSTSAKATYVLTCGTISGPTVTMTPSSQSGQPGDTLVYGVTIKNPNTSTLCGSRTYSLSSTVTNLNGTGGWTTSLAASTITLASGESASTTLSVTSPTNAAAPWAVYKPTVTVTDDLSNSATKAAFYAIVCESNPPTLTLSPASVSTAPGTDNPITVTITDNDTYNCPWTMTMWSTLPGGWTETTLPSEITLSGGQSTTVTWTPHVPSGAADGTYSPVLWIDNAGVASSATAAFDVACSHAAPTVTLSPSTQSGSAGSTLSYTASITNNDASTCASQKFTLSSSVPSGWTDSLDTTTVTLAPGASTTATLDVTSASSAYGTNSVGVTATGAKSAAASGTASYVVTCTTAKPTVTLSPSSQSGAAGAALAYTATIKNKNTGCAPETLSVAASVPAGWIGDVSSTSVALASNASTTVTLTATSAATATGTNTVGVKAMSVAGTTTGTASYVVSCTRTAPTVSLSPSSKSGPPGTAQAYTATITNNDSGCSSGTFTVAASVPSGWTGSVSSTSVSLAAGASTTVTLSATPPTSANGSNTVGVTASNANSGSTTGTATFDVTCTHAAPSVTLSPSSQSGTAGSTLSYTATIKNNDSGCASGVFSLSSSVPAGWTGALGVSSVTLAAGASTTTTFSVTSPGSATGTNTVSVTADNPSSGTTTGSGTYTISVPCTHNTPTIAISPSTQTTTGGTALAYTVTVTNNDTSGCTAGTFTLSRTLPSMPPGWSGTWSSSSLSLSAGASGTSTLTVTSPSMIMPSTYSFSATATNASSGAATATASYVVATCTRSTPTVSVSPSSQSGLAGAALAYTVTVTNNDSAACATTTFTLGSSLSSGWTGSYSAGTLALAAGGSGTSTWTVTSSGAAAANSYSVTATAASATSSTGSGSATYVVTPPCTRAAPMVTVAPSSQSGLAGASLAYTVTVKNNDSATCASATFTLGSTLTSGWSGSYSAASLSLAPSASGTSTWTVTSAGNAAANSYTVSATAASATSSTGSGSATYVVTPPCTRAVPTVSVSPSTQSGVAGASLAYTVSITNNDSATCTSSAFTLASTVPAGWSGSYSSGSAMLAPGASTTSTLTVTSAGAASSGNNTITATASSGASGSGSGTATYVVSPPCTHAAPTVAIAPSTQSGTAGSALAYTVTVTNNDSASCSSGTFALTSGLPAAPSGWDGSYSQGQLTLVPGASGTATLTVTSPLGASATSYTIAATAANGTSGSGSTTATYAVVPTCVRATPAVSVSPSTQSGTAGTTLTYTATITNEDSGCSTSTFSLTGSAPAGWTATPSSASVALGSGGSTTVTFAVTSAGNAPAGAYMATLTAQSGTSGAGTGDASYDVVAACVRGTPMVELAPATQTSSAGGTLSYTATITNTDTACGSSVFALAGSGPAGWTVSPAQASVSIASGTSTTVAISATSAANASPATYAISVSATTGASGSGSGSASYVVSPTCTHAAPTVAITPDMQSANAGNSAAYSVTVTNNDSGCAPGSFALAGTLPSGWSSTFSTSPLSLAAGASASVTWTVTASAAATTGVQSITAAASNGASGSGTDAAMFDVTPTCVPAAPTVTLAPATLSGGVGSQLVYTATITNHDTSCAAQTFAISHSEPAGFTGAVANASVNLAAGASTTVPYTVSIGASAPVGSLLVHVAATGPSGTTTGDATAEVTPTCAHGVPTVAVSPAAQAGAAGATLTYTLTIASTSTGCGDEALEMSAVLPDGWAHDLPGDVMLSAGASTAVAWNVTSSAAATAGDYTLVIGVADGGASAGYTVTADADSGDNGDAGGCNSGRSNGLALALAFGLCVRRRRRQR